MRQIEARIYSHLDLEFRTNKKKDISASEPMFVEDFMDLVKKIAILSFYNKDYLLFFRGQRRDHHNLRAGSSFYPSIYRTKQYQKLTTQIVKARFEILEQASGLLMKKLQERNLVDSFNELKRKKIIQWGILQHYEVCQTPLLDLTQSLRVACSFALSEADEFGYVFIFGLPYISNRISFNSEHDIVNIRLINICPPEALRPYFQEGSLVGTSDVTDDYEKRNDLDFKRRLIAKFKILEKTGLSRRISYAYRR